MRWVGAFDGQCAEELLHAAALSAPTGRTRFRNTQQDCALAAGDREAVAKSNTVGTARRTL